MSPYKIKGKTVVKSDTGKVVGHSENPEKYLRTLQAKEHNWRSGKTPSGKTPTKKSLLGR
jgi:hypothetical protein